MAISKLTQLAEERPTVDFQSNPKDSMQWLKQKISEIRNPKTVVKEIIRERSRFATSIRIGKLYCFAYDPKGKEELPYYDIFPMVLVLEKYNDGFLGLNLHYLPYNYRVAFLNKLLKYAVLDDEDNPQRLRITYDILSASKRFKEFNPCIKRYLYGQVQSRILTIQPNEWQIATLLPLQQFRKAPAKVVWQESMQDIRKI
jgi:hypothetical protein